MIVVPLLLLVEKLGPQRDAVLRAQLEDVADLDPLHLLQHAPTLRAGVAGGRIRADRASL